MIQSRPNELQVDEPATSLPGSDPQDRLKHHTQEAREMAGDVRQKASEAAAQAGEKLREVGRQAKDQVMATACQTTRQAKEKASTVISDQKNRLADQVSGIGQALHKAADTLDQSNDQAGSYVHQAADTVDSVANWLRDKDASEMVRGCGDFTRRHPEVVLGGLFLAGVALARFLKASERRRERESFADLDRDYGDMNEGRGLEYGYRDAGYGDVGMYAGSDVEEYGRTQPFGVTGASSPGSMSDTDVIPDLPREEASLTRNTDIPDVTSPQPGSYPPVTPSGTFFEAGEERRTATQGDRGKSEACDINPTKPR